MFQGSRPRPSSCNFPFLCGQYLLLLFCVVSTFFCGQYQIFLLLRAGYNCEHIIIVTQCADKYFPKVLLAIQSDVKGNFTTPLISIALITQHLDPGVFDHLRADDSCISHRLTINIPKDINFVSPSSLSC